MTFLPSDSPPHQIAALDNQVVRAALEEVVARHLQICEECQAWREARGPEIDWRRWLQ